MKKPPKMEAMELESKIIATKSKKTATRENNRGKKVNRTLLKDLGLETFENCLVYYI